MTLCTRVRVYDPTPLEPLWSFCRGLVGASDEVESSESAYGRTLHRMNRPGSGCAALLDLLWSPDGFLPADEERERPCMYEVGFDTPYAAETCGHFQALAVSELAGWLDERGVGWEWQDEHSGDWFDTLDEVPLRLGDPDFARVVV